MPVMDLEVANMFVHDSVTDSVVNVIGGAVVVVLVVVVIAENKRITG